MMWRFFVVPDGPRQSFETPELAMAIKTWSSEHDWSFGGGGNPWNAISYDADEDLVYVGTGNGPTEGQPARNVGTGAHLFASCILAINATTGRLVWYYQTTPGDEWDYDATENLVLANLRIRGRSRHVVMQANKNGFYYVLDRSTGQLLAADNFVPVNWASGVNPTTGKPNVLLKNADWRESVKLVFPGEYGAHNWMAMAFDPIAGLAFIPAQDIGWIEGADPEAYFYMGYDTKTLTGSDQPPRAHGELIAWDPVTRTARWRVVLTTIINGGVLATAGDLVVQGTSDGYIRVYESKSGRLLKQISIGTGIVAPPISYAVNGVQYIAVCAGWSGWQTEVPPPDSPAPYSNAGRIIVLRLKGGPVAMAQRVPLAPYLAIATPQRPPVVAKGKSLYAANCGSCHTVYGEGSVYPDLRRMSVAAYANFHQIVLNGLLRDGGMASFAGVLSSDDVEAIKAYIVDWSQRSAAKKTVH
jgi:PQQ-dependent dehydrogenase (methanol/ethanol family)